MDVKTALLNGNLTENVHITQPEDFVDPKNSDKVCKLQKPIYGLKQASRSWNLRFDEYRYILENTYWTDHTVKKCMVWNGYGNCNNLGYQVFC
ncbi:hypothetical protein LUZ60_006523 [Juncus effusus]|nr:hypothetical protein LUZ60_006523 [Juncus effusus]